MPRGNGTGPDGYGPITGRAAGYCDGYEAPGYMNPEPGANGAIWCLYSIRSPLSAGLYSTGYAAYTGAGGQCSQRTGEDDAREPQSGTGANRRA